MIMKLTVADIDKKVQDAANTRARLQEEEERADAELQNLTPKYFGTVSREATGIGVGEWIANYVIVQAKFLLRHQSNLTIQQVSNKLGFKEQTTFSRYFKTYTGMSPKEYRES